MKSPFTVLAECSDLRTGKRLFKGDAFDPAPTPDQAKRLVAAGCLPNAAIEAAQAVEDAGGVDPAALMRDQINHDGLFDKTIDELKAIVDAETVAPSDKHMKAAIIASIRAHRLRLDPVPETNAIEMRTEKGEAAARATDAAAVRDATDPVAADVPTEPDKPSNSPRAPRTR